jgi:hypothetical protein
LCHIDFLFGYSSARGPSAQLTKELRVIPANMNAQLVGYQLE